MAHDLFLKEWYENVLAEKRDIVGRLKTMQEEHDKLNQMKIELEKEALILKGELKRIDKVINDVFKIAQDVDAKILEKKEEKKEVVNKYEDHKKHLDELIEKQKEAGKCMYRYSVREAKSAKSVNADRFCTNKADASGYCKKHKKLLNLK